MIEGQIKMIKIYKDKIYRVGGTINGKDIDRIVEWSFDGSFGFNFYNIQGKLIQKIINIPVEIIYS